MIGVDVNRLPPLLAFASLPSLSVRPWSATRSSRQCSVAALGTSIGEVAALVALPPGIALSPGCIVGTVGAKVLTPRWCSVPVLLVVRGAFRPPPLWTSRGSVTANPLSSPASGGHLFSSCPRLPSVAKPWPYTAALAYAPALGPRCNTATVFERATIRVPRLGCSPLVGWRFPLLGFSFLCGYFPLRLRAGVYGTGLPVASSPCFFLS